MKVYKHVVFCVLLLLIGCSPFDYAPNYNHNESVDIQLHSNAVAVFRLTNGDNKSSRWGYGLNIGFMHEEKDSKAAIIGCNTSDNVWHAKLIKEGRYRLSDIAKAEANVEYHYSYTTRTVQYWPISGIHFSVKKGEVVYIGDFVFYPSTGGFGVKNRFEEVKKNISKTMPELASRLQERVVEGEPYENI
ncbi:hypothetical protein FACS189449_13030 [Alphaproteobacteria bacterium]|nr:hypothetical protein FACS189449_13030 [Alphaproteobacteria bacterium]